MATEKSKKARVLIGTTTTALNLREEPSTDADILYIIPEGKPVVIDKGGSTDDFYKVNVQGLIGYCMKEYIKL